METSAAAATTQGLPGADLKYFHIDFNNINNIIKNRQRNQKARHDESRRKLDP
jgi:hypothetical protein